MELTRKIYQLVMRFYNIKIGSRFLIYYNRCRMLRSPKTKLELMGILVKKNIQT
jgi:hypothetical protein